MARKTMSASISLPRNVFVQVEGLAKQVTNDVFSKTVAQLVEVGLRALETGWQAPQGWWPESGRQVIYYYGLNEEPEPVLLSEEQEVLDLPKTPLPADLL